ncbi:response regulator transcription factor [Skermanella mucosa]|uniref:LuxR C-terminal-related transcriptional regulator n=1 Tax=Skermanella mucosa TaxID=1789672 RepID=UPI00192AD167|nr:response regulator transcription factor [Skermanella mucosa]UEM19650.1 response regulator transcription factor [Skermanella mucosa]
MNANGRTILVESNRLFREGLKHLLAGTRFEVGAEFNTMEQAIAHGGQEGPGQDAEPALVITGQAIKAAADLQQLRDTYPSARIVVLADDMSVDMLRDAMGGGADGFLIKNVSPEALIQSLQLIMLGEKVFPTNLAAMLLDINAPSPQNSIRGLSPREQEILQSLVTGASNKMIAIRLGITEATVKVHLKTLLRKIDVNNRTQAAIWAMNNGFSAEGSGTPTRNLQAVSA